MGFKPTQSQQNVLDSKNQNVVVSASAGSGKTTLMIEKVIKTLIEEDADISKFLICTFTNNAGEEMKSRLYEKLQDQIQKNQGTKESDRLIRNFEKVEQANICTIDKFCLDLVKKYFYKLKIDANIKILSTFDANFLKNRAFKQALEKLEKKDAFALDLICSYFLQDRSEEKLKELVFKIYNNMQTRANGEKYLNETAFSLYSNENSEKLIADHLAKFENAVKKLNDVYCATLPCLNSADGKLIERLSHDSEILQSYFNLDEKNKIKFIFDININSQLYGNKEFVPTLTKEKGDFNQALLEVRAFFVTSNLDDIKKYVKETKLMIERLVSFVDYFKECYDTLKLQQNQFEFADIQHLAFDLLDKKEILEDCIKDIDYVFVDEYQDVNYLQEAFVDKLSKSDNLFLVGDIKQSIYGFRLSTPLILKHKIEKYEADSKSLSERLNENFRSDKQILDFVNDSFCEIMTEERSGVDYRGTSQLVGSKSFDNGKNFGNKVEIDVILKEEAKSKTFEELFSDIFDIKLKRVKNEKTEKEANFIVDKITNALTQTIYDTALDKVRPVKFGDIAVLFRSGGELYKSVVQKLIENGCPVSASFKEDIFASLEVEFVNSVLKLTKNFEDDISLANVLSFPSINLSEDDFASIRLQDMTSKYFASAVLNYAKNNKDEISDKINELLDFLKFLNEQSYFVNVYDMVKLIENHYKLYDMLYAMRNQKLIGNYQKFLSEIQNLENLGLVDYLQYLQTRNKEETEITISGGEDSVVCQTIHKSKGLEYPIVILADAGKDIKYRSEDILITDLGIGADYYNAEKKEKSKCIVKNYLNSLMKANELEEEKRLLYVALTRAKNQLIIIGTSAVKKLKTHFSEYSEPSYLQLILGFVSETQKENLVENGHLNLANARVNIVEDEENVLQTNQPMQIVLNSQQEKYVINYLNFNYPYLENVKYAYKNSVSSLLKNEVSGESYSPNPQNLETIEHSIFKRNEVGTMYHSILEQIDFSTAQNVEKVEKLIDANGYNEVVKVEEILKIVAKVKTLINEGDIIRKEQPFIFKAKHCDIANSNCEDEVLVQGVIDLLIEKPNGKILIVDYKHTSIQNGDVLKNKYAKQLKLYEYATKLVTNASVIETYLLSIKDCNLLQVD